MKNFFKKRNWGQSDLKNSQIMLVSAVLLLFIVWLF